MPWKARRAPPPAEESRPPTEVMSQYDKTGALRPPEDYRRWVMIGASLGLSYSEGPATTTCSRHVDGTDRVSSFVETGPSGKARCSRSCSRDPATRCCPARRGQFANEVHGVEMAVKDSSHVPEGSAYDGFGGMGGAIRTPAAAEPKTSCFSCHAEHAARDHVFLQFYPLLTTEAAA